MIIKSTLLMSLEARKINLVQYILGEISEEKLSAIESFIDKDEAILKSKLIKRALRAEEDIKNGKVFTLDEVNSRLQSKFGI